MSKTLDNLLKAHPLKIEGWYHDSDGYWLDLKNGWELDGCHGIHENTVNEVIAHFRMVRPCQCNDCLQEDSK